ncbi:MAG: hypothetical protein K0Q99_2018, partial [Clostridia bacterium]|nr:hypothetical protein [Clostridia bacterium]
MKGLRIDYSKAMIKPYEIENMKEQIKAAHHQLHHKTGAGN